MEKLMKKRILEEASYMIDNNSTIRELAKKFNVSKSTIHIDLSKRLNKIDKNLFKKVKDILKYHDLIKHIRGGEVTKIKYKKRNV